MKPLFEQMGGTYTRQGDYYIPDLALPPQEEFFIGRFGQLHLRYIKKNKRVFYTNLLTSGELNQYLHTLDEQASERFHTIVAALAKAENTDETLKASDPMRWVGLMNNYRHSAEKIVLKELVYVIHRIRLQKCRRILYAVIAKS